MLPVINAASECSFSVLKYLKNYLISTLGETTLNVLVHRVVTFPEKYNVGNFPEFFRKNSGIILEIFSA